MTIATALLARATTELSTERIPADVLATVVEVDTPRSGHYGQDVPLLVTRTQPMRSAHLDRPGFQQSWPGLHGMVINVRGANTSHNGWVANTEIRREYDDDIRVFGALINPPMVSGHYYRIISTTVGQYRGHVVRYQPEDNTRLCIVQRGDGLPVVNPDGWNSWDESVFCYVEVTNPDTEPEPPVSTDELVDLLDPVAVGIPTHLPEDHLPRYIRQYVSYEADGRGAALNPEPIVGDVYAVWWHRESFNPADATVAMRVSSTEFTKLGEINRWGYEADTATMDFTEPEGEMRWVAINATREPHMEGEAALTSVTEETERIATIFDGMLDALHEMADAKGWCGEYEDVMHRGGMLGRPSREQPPAPERHAYDMEVTAYFHYSGSQPDSGVDSDLAERWDIDNVDISDITFNASRSITIEGVVGEDEATARETLDNSRVLEELNGCLGEIDADEVTRFTIDDVTEDENYDFSDDTF